MDVPLNVDVQCADGLCGRSTTVIVNPIKQQVTHVVVRERAFPHVEHLVPIECVVESTPVLIRLRCTENELSDVESFTETEFIEGDVPLFDYDPDGYMSFPYALPDSGMIPVNHERVPPEELAVHRGAQVEATDGHVGWVDEFLVDPKTEHITHLILREGHLWGQKDVSIPISAIARIEEDTVRLKLDRKQISALPAIPVRRWPFRA